MQYSDGKPIQLGDLVTVPVPSGDAEARVVMLGDTREHSELDPDFLSWVKATDRPAATDIVIEWTAVNPLAHADPDLAPVGNYMFTVVDELVRLKARAAA